MNQKSCFIRTVLFGVIVNVIAGDISHLLENYDIIEDVELHSISERDTHGTAISRKHLKLRGLGRNFSSWLSPVTDLFSHDFKAETEDNLGKRKQFQFNKENFLEGVLEDDKNSKVHAYVDEDGTVTATISSQGEDIVIEPEWRHLKQRKKSRKMIMYKVHEMKWPGNRPQSNFNFCGASHGNGTSTRPEEIHFSTHNHQDHSHHRGKRSTNVNCRLIAVADYKFYTGIGGSSEYTTANYMATTIEKANLIYRGTNFGGLTGLGFVISAMIIKTSYNTVDGSATHYNMENGNWRSNTKGFLETFSAADAATWTDYCLAHLFTHQPFDNNILGVAYIAGPRSIDVGGLCSPLTYVNGLQSSLNTGFSSTMYSNGATVLLRQAELVTAHGHNWGSYHDPDSGDCSPSSFFGGGGKYLMNAYSVSGDDSNNDDFSSCSRSSIGTVINAKLQCLSEAEVVTLCGNGRIDGGEACDGGYLGKFNLDNCCTPECTLRGSAVCTPVNYGCCSDTCQISPANTYCNPAAECKNIARCDGSSLTCPVGTNKDNGIQCTGGFCNSGTCQPFCEYAGRTSCACAAEANSCRRCCIDSSNQCTPYNSSVYLPDNSPCTVGYCLGGYCRKTEPSLTEKFFEFIDQISFDFVAETFKTNMVAIIQAFSLIVWIPACLFCWCRDRQKKKQYRKEMTGDCRYDRCLTFDEDRRQVKRKKKVQPKFIPAEAVSYRSLSRSGSAARRNKISPLPSRQI